MERNRVHLYFKVVLAFLVTLGAGTFLVQLNDRNELLASQRTATEIALSHGHLLHEQLDRSLSATYALAAVIRQGKGEVDNFTALANEMLRLYEGASSLSLVPGGVVRQIVPLAGNEGAVGHDLLKDPKRSKEALAAIASRKLTLAGPFNLRQGGVGVIGRLPVFLPDQSGKEQFWGFTAVVIPIAELLNSSQLNAIAAAHYDYELSRLHPDSGVREVFARSSQEPLRKPVSFPIEVPNGEWTLSMAPTGGWPASGLAGVAGAVVILVSVLVAMLLYSVLQQPLVLRREVDLRTRELTQSNRELADKIVEHRQAENALRESENRFRTMADTAPVLIWITAEDLRMRYVNRAWLAFTGRRQERELGTGWARSMRRDDLRAFVRSCKPAVAVREPFRTEARLRRHDGQFRWLSIHGVPRLTPEGHFAGYIGSCLDITDLKLAETVLRQARDELERRVGERTAELTQANGALTLEIEERKRVETALQQEKRHQQALIKKLEEAQNQLLQSEKMASIGQLAAGVAHEINNPIGFVSANLGTLQDYAQDLLSVVAAYEQWADPLLVSQADARAEIAATKQRVDLDYLRQDVSSLLHETREGVMRVKNIVQDLREFSHVSEAEWQMADLHQGMDSTLNVVWNELKYKARVVKEYGVIPPVECLASQINQVFMNLLINAAHAIAETGIITLRSGQEDGAVWVEVADTGAGIAPENLRRIFEPFFTTKPVGQGTGLGLSLSYGIIHRHGGRIEVESQVGKGTAFRVWLPIRRQVEREEAPAAFTQAAPG